MLTRDAKVFGRTWSANLCANPLARKVMDAMSREAPRQADPVLDRARADSPLVDAVITVDFDKTKEHVLQHFRAMLTLPTDRIGILGDDPMAFVRAHGVRRARAGVPLNTVLQGYRTGHKAFWAVICRTIDRLAPSAADALPATMLLSDYCIEYTDLISNVLTQAYLAEEALLAAQRTRLSVTVLDDLLNGKLPGTAEATEFCARHGLAVGRRMVVGVIRGDSQCSTARQLGQVAQNLEGAIPPQSFGRMIELHNEGIVIIASSAADTGRRLAMALRDTAHDWQAGSGMRAGIGLDVDSIGDIPRSHAEAVLALDLDEADIAHMADVHVGHYLRRRADETAIRLLPSWTTALVDSDLAGTLRAYAAASMNIKVCAARLDVHGNTIYHRLARVQRITGLDPRTYPGLTQMLDVLAIARPGEA